MGRPAGSKNKKTAAKKQETLPGVKDPGKVVEIEDAALAVSEANAAISAGQEAREMASANLMDAMKAAKLKTYRCRDLVPVLEVSIKDGAGPKVSVRRVQQAPQVE